METCRARRGQPISIGRRELLVFKQEVCGIRHSEMRKVKTIKVRMRKVKHINVPWCELKVTLEHDARNPSWLEFESEKMQKFLRIM